MTKISQAARGLVRRAGLAVVAAVVATAASHQRAEALSLASPTTVPSAKYASEGLTLAVRGGHHGGGGFRGGGGFHGGGFHGGGGFRAVHGGGFRAAPIYRSSGFRAAHIYRGGYQRFGGYRIHRYAHYRPYFHRRHHFHHRRFFHRRYYAPYYSYPRCHYPYRYSCRVVWTYWGPRKVCRCRLPVRPYYWRYGW